MSRELGYPSQAVIRISHLYKNTNAPPQIDLQNSSSFRLTALRVVVGQEIELLRTLSNKNKSALYFKILGKYDVLEFASLPSLQSANKVTRAPHILGIASFPCFRWGSSSPNILQQISDVTLPSVIFLKLNQTIIDNIGFEAAARVISFIESNPSLKSKKIHCLGLTGLGFYEIILWHLTNNIERTFELLRFIRQLRIQDIFPSFNHKTSRNGAFSDTMTMPLISFKKIIATNNWEAIEGKIRPILRVRCAPNNDLKVGEHFKTAAFDILGEDDVIFEWNQPIPINDFLPKLLGFREKWRNKPGLFDTTTNLLSVSPLPLSSIKPPSEFRKPIPYIYERLQTLSKVQRISQSLLIEYMCIVSIINAYIARNAGDELFDEVTRSINSINVLLKDYYAALAEGDLIKYSTIEGDLLQFANWLRIGLSQITPNVEFSDPNFGPPLSTVSLAKVLLSISNFVSFIFQKIVGTKPPRRLLKEANRQKKWKKRRKIVFTDEFKSPWRGFIFFDPTAGYQICLGEIISLPLSDIFKPLDWITVTHEIGHSYFNRIFFMHVEQEFLNNLLENIDKPKKGIIQRELDDYANEFFADWFDYKHFFKDDLDFYIWHIWRTWIYTPRVFIFTPKYWMRTVFLRLCNRWNIIDEAIAEIQKQNGYQRDDKTKKDIMMLLNREINYTTALVKRFFPEAYHKIKLTSQERKEVLEGLYLMYHFASVFERYYVNDDLRKALNKPYPQIDNHIDSLMNGKVITDSIPNPFLLTKNLLRKAMFLEHRRKASLDKISVAFIHSLLKTSVS